MVGMTRMSTLAIAVSMWPFGSCVKLTVGYPFLSLWRRIAIFVFVLHHVRTRFCNSPTSSYALQQLAVDTTCDRPSFTLSHTPMVICFSQPLRVGLARQLFFDDAVVDVARTNTTRTMRSFDAGDDPQVRPIALIHCCSDSIQILHNKMYNL